MKRVALLAMLPLAGCTQVQAYGNAAAELRRQQNDLQAKGTMLAICDLSVGSVARLPQDQRDVALKLCGLEQTPVILLPQKLRMSEAGL